MSNGLTKSSGHTRGDIERANTVALGRSERLPRGGDMGAAPRRISKSFPDGEGHSRRGEQHGQKH